MKRVLFSLFVLILCIWLIPLSYCEILTMKYGNDELLALCNEYCSSMVDELDTLKVLEYNDLSFCKVYCRNKTSGHIFELKYSPDTAQTDSKEQRLSQWRVTKWDTRWANGGNADEIVWPYVFDILYAYCP